ncbi:hypothetical protein ElyMa_006402600, partial [Elysia marginata]
IASISLSRGARSGEKRGSSNTDHSYSSRTSLTPLVACAAKSYSKALNFASQHAFTNEPEPTAVSHTDTHIRNSSHPFLVARMKVVIVVLVVLVAVVAAEAAVVVVIVK